jgi:hypothetical protein
MGVQVSLPDLIPSAIPPEVVLLDHMAGLFLVFEEPAYCFP